MKETYKSGEQVTYTCHQSDGSPLIVREPRVCQADGSWSGRAPDCRASEQLIITTPAPAANPDSIVFPGSQDQNVIAVMPGGFWVPKPNVPIDSINVGATKTSRKPITTTTPVPMLPEFDYYEYEDKSIVTNSQGGDVNVNSIENNRVIGSNRPEDVENNILRNSDEENEQVVNRDEAKSEPNSSESDKSSSSTMRMSECLVSVCIFLVVTFKYMATK